MTLSIITINYNNAEGLEKTMQSVLFQTSREFEYIVVDGASSDSSIDIIKRFSDDFGDRLTWISEPDKGIYNAMNKGVRMASGKYLEFLNSGDCLVDKTVVGKMFCALEENGYPSILYGNMLKDMPGGRVVRDRCFKGEPITLFGMYHGCLNHSPAYIQRDLFEKYGLYDESLKICSDWKWYLSSIVLGEENPVYIDIDVTLFDMHGISETNKELLSTERELLLSQMIPEGILADYRSWFTDIGMIKRLKKVPIVYAMVRFIDRAVFKVGKWLKIKNSI